MNKKKRTKTVSFLALAGMWLAFGLALPCLAQVKLFIISGQSNADGRGYVSDLEPPYDQVQTNIPIWFDYDATNWIHLEPGLSPSFPVFRANHCKHAFS